MPDSDDDSDSSGAGALAGNDMQSLAWKHAIEEAEAMSRIFLIITINSNSGSGILVSGGMFLLCLLSAVRRLANRYFIVVVLWGGPL